MMITLILMITQRNKPSSLKKQKEEERKKTQIGNDITEKVIKKDTTKSIKTPKKPTTPRYLKEYRKK